MPEVCIVIPCYNEEQRLDKHAMLSFMQCNPSVHLCLVNDGSTDKTMDLLNQIKVVHPDTVLVIDKKNNAGKAEAVRTGIMESSKWKDFLYFGYFDADFSTPLSESINLLMTIKSTKTNFVLGSRIKRLGATIERSRYRHLLGRIFSTFASVILKLPVYDTQCGAKLISKQWIDTAFNQAFLSSWLFDVEILARLRNKFGKDKLIALTVEFPLNVWIEKGGTKIRFVHLLKVPLELWNIHKYYNK